MNQQTTVYADATAAKPRKLFYRINEVAKMTGLKPYVLRYWETEFAELAPEKDTSDQRRYRQKDIEVIRAIRRLLYEEGFTIKGARQRLKIELRKGGEGDQPAPKSKTTRPQPQAARSEIAEKPAPRAASSARKLASPALNGKSARSRDMTLGETLYHLRNEVTDLLKILGA